jgi:diguanylate cyclase (GGDEF)-like protein
VAAYALIAEFDREWAELCRDAVEAQGVRAVIVRDGTAAARLTETRGAPLLLITDLSLPNSDGFSLIQHVRRISPPEKTAVIVSSAFAEFRNAASRLRGSLGIFEITDKKLPAEAFARLVARALTSVTGPSRKPALDTVERDELVRRILFRVAQTFRVPFVLLSIELREQRRLIAYMATNESQGAARQWPILQQVINTRTPLVVPDVTKHALVGIVPVAPTFVIRGFAAAPLITKSGHLVGAMSLLDFEPLTLTAGQIDLLMNAAQRIGDELEREYRDELARAELAEHLRSEESWAALERLALTDPLTMLSNRRAGERALDREIARARRAGSPFSLALFDLDHFKQINDVHGHAVGDDVLCEVSRILTSTFRASDLAVRWGGDEFLVVLPDVTLAGAVVFAERARLLVESLSLAGIPRVTMSVGIVEVEREEDPRTALTRADAKLYEAKAAGRNRVSAASDQSETGRNKSATTTPRDV